jgi:uncharacterized membrane protein YcaP (DUF421 family)
MSTGIFDLALSPIEIVLRTVLVYAAFLLAMRIFGKREVGQLTLPDLVLVLLVANALQPAMTGPDSSVSAAFIIILTMFVLNYAVAQLRTRSARFERLITPSKTKIAEDGRWDRRALRKEGISMDEAEEAVRLSGVMDVSGTAAVFLESDGRISVIRPDASGTTSGRQAS